MIKTLNWRSGFLWSVATLFSAVLPPHLMMGQSRNDTIAISGDAAPDGNGFLGFLSQPRLNNFGQVTFSSFNMTGTVNGSIDDGGVFRTGVGGLVQIERTNANLLGVSGPRINDLGQVAYNFVVPGGAFLDPRNGIRKWDGQNLTTLALEPAGVGHEVFGVSGINNNGQVAFRRLVNSVFRIERSGVGPSLIIAEENQVVPGGDGTFGNLDLSTSLRSLNEQGQIAFVADVTSSSATNQGIFRGDGSTLDSIVRKGQSAPDGNGVFSNLSEFSSPQISINDQGQVAFVASLSGTTGGTVDARGLFVGDGTSLTQILRSGQASPDGNGSFGLMVQPHLNNSGQIAFLGVMDENDGGIFRASTTGVTKIARTGGAAFDGNGFFSTSFDKLIQNDAGQTAFVASTSDSVGGIATGEGLFTSDGIDSFTVVRFGDSIAGSTVIAIDDGADDPLALNRHGQIAYRARLDDGRDVIQTWTPDLHWRSSTSGDWDNGNNWTLSLNPAEVHDVLIDPSLSLVVRGPANDANVRKLTVGGGGGTATLVLNGSELATANAPGPGVTVLNNGVLAGNGQINGNTQILGTLAPGESVGQISFQGNLTLTESANLLIELGGSANGQFDQFAVFDDLFLNGSLDVRLINNHVLGNNDFYLIGEIGGELIGQFQGLSEGDLVGTFGGRALFITYAGGNGNDIGLFTSVPEPSSAWVIGVSLMLFGSYRRRRSNPTS